MKYLLFSCIYLISACLYGQKKWALKDCIKYALSNHQDIRKLDINIESNRNLLQQSKNFLLPSINANISPNYNIGYSINPLTYSFENVNSITGSIGLNAEFIVFNGFQNLNHIKKTKNDWATSLEEKRASEIEISLNILNLFFQVLLEKEVFKSYDKKLSIAQKQLFKVDEMIKVGKLTIIDKQEVTVQYSREKAILLKQKNIVQLALFKLKQAMCLHDSSEFDIEYLRSTAFFQKSDRLESSKSKQILDQLPHINSKKLFLHSLKYKLEIDKGGRYPSLALSYGIGSNFINTARDIKIVQGYSSVVGFVNDANRTEVIAPPQSYQSEGDNTPVLSQLSSNLQHRLSLSLQVPIFDKLKKINQIKLAKLGIKSHEEDIKKTELKMIEELEIMKYNIQNAWILFESNKEIYKAYEVLLEAQREKYDNGIISNFEYQNAVNNYVLSTIEYSKSRIEIQYRNAIFSIYCNTILEDINY